MLSKIVLVFFLATLAVSFAKVRKKQKEYKKCNNRRFFFYHTQDDHENELINTALGSGTNLLREFSKLVADDADKYSLDLNSLYKKYEIPAKASQAKSYLQSQVCTRLLSNPAVVCEVGGNVRKI